MASARLRRREKQFEELARENARLHRDVEDLETAFFLHRQVLQEEENSVRGLIRKEVGGSRWEHGGTGKLTTYKSNKDLQESAGNHSSVKTVRNGSASTLSNQNAFLLETDKQTGGNTGSDTGLVSRNHSSQVLDEKGNTKITDLYKDKNQLQHFDGDSGKILDLKTKILKKASSKVIKRDNWASPDRHSERKTENVASTKVNQKASKNSGKVDKTVIKPKRNLKQKKDIWTENINSDTYKVDRPISKALLHETTGGLVSDHDQNADSSVIVQPSGKFETRLSRRDLHESGDEKASKSEVLFSDRNEVEFSNTYAVERTFITEDPDHLGKVNVLDGTGNKSNFDKSKVEETAEIFIDPNNAQVRIRCGGGELFKDISGTEDTQVLIQPETIQEAAVPQAFTYSILEKNKSPAEVRDIFGLQDLERKHELQNGVNTKTTASLSPFALTKHCDTEVEFWLRGLGLNEVEQYVEMFADNEIDLLDLEFMSATQLHEMGVTDTEALNTLLNGIRELKNLPPDKYVKAETLNIRKGLQASSIAWDDNSTELPVKMSSDLKQTSKKGVKTHSSQSNKNKTFMKGKDETLKSQNRIVHEIDSSRCDSAVSHISECSSRSSRATTRNQNSLPMNAQSKASNKNQKSQMTNAQSRASDKCQSSETKSSARLGSAKSEKLPPSSKPQLQKKTSNVSDKKQKPANVAADNKSRLQALEAKPTRSVLLKRSSSLTRETGRGQGQNQKGSKGPESAENRRPAVRARSRSADAVKRKALEGVQAAAKKHEEKLLKDREIEETKHKIQEKKKTERDEMAARHLQREKNKMSLVTDPVVSERSDVSQSPDSTGLENLVTVSVLSHSDKRETVGMSATDAVDDKSKTRVIAPTPQSRKSLRRIEPVKKSVGQTTVKPWDRLVQSDYEAPLLSTYKIETKTKEGAASEPESGYRTDSSTTYSQVEEKVAEIQHKIKRLKSRATSGDEVTLTLVKDLQIELQHFEKLLTEKEKAIKYQRPDKVDERKSVLALQSEPSQNNKQIPETSTPRPRQPSPSTENQQLLSPIQEQRPKPIPRRPSTFTGNSKSNQTAQKAAVIEDLLIEDSVVKGGDDVMKDKAAMSMSKKELLDEMRKEKHQHHRQIRQLQSELKRMRETDAASSMELSQNDISYREEDLVGEGAFSQVFRGTYQGSEVAIKRLVVPLAAQDRNYFAAEVSLLRELRHPRVVLLIGVCTSDRLPLMVLEYMSRGSLFNHLHNAQNEPLDHAEYYQVARDIALGMNYLHSHKPEVLHLDLKSMNVLLCQSFRAKIADFGFSKLRHDATVKLTQKGKPRQPRGSPSWMAPELVDKEEITCKADIYSFAIILWEMLTRQIPYENASVFQVLEMVRKNKRPELPSSSPEGLRLLISSCWDQNPAKRPHFKDVVVSLENLAFPPAWRELFQKAGVPEEALHNIESTRTLINLVTTTLDSNSFKSFMISDSKVERGSSRETSSDTSGDTTASTCIQRKTTDKNTDGWESDTVSEISEIPTEHQSEFSLGTLRESSDESTYDTARETVTENTNYEDSSELSSDDSVVLPISSQRKSPRKKLNVFVPSLKLSMTSPIADTAKDESSKFDWVSISLDDRTCGEERISHTYSPNKQTTHLNLSDSSNAVTPLSLSARPKEKKSWQEKAKEMDEYLMRESINNRRPSSPIRKRLSLTKKLAERTSKSLDTDQTLGNRIRSLDAESMMVDKIPYTERQTRIGLNDSNNLTSLSRKLADLNSKSLDPVENKLLTSNGQFRKVLDDDLTLMRHTNSDEPVRVTLNEPGGLGVTRDSRPVGFNMDKSYDSFYSLPVNNLQTNLLDNNLQPKDGSFRKSEVVLHKSGSFTKSKDVLDLLETQIKHTTKTLEEMEQESSTAAFDPVIDNKTTFKVELKAAVGTKQSRDFIEQTEGSQQSKEHVVSNKALRSTGVQTANSIHKRNTKAQVSSKQDSLEEYHKFLQKEILHDSGGSIEDIKKSLVEKGDVRNSTLNDAEKIVDKDAKKEVESTDVEKVEDTEAKKEEEKESIRVVLNPDDVGKKPVKTPRRSKMKECKSPQEMNNVNGYSADKPLTDDLNDEFKTSESAFDIIASSVDEPLELEDKTECVSKRNDEVEKSAPFVSVTDSLQVNEAGLNEDTKELKQVCTETSDKDKNLTISIIKKTGTNLGKSNSSDTEKVKLLPKEEHWKQLSEKPKTADVMKNAVNKGKITTDVENKMKLPAKPKKTIRVKLKKDPLVPVVSEEPSSPVPPAPPPPPPPPGSFSMSNISFSKRVQLPRPAASMADELKLRVASWQSRSFQKSIVKSKHEPQKHKAITQSRGFPAVSKKYLDSVAEDDIQLEDSLDDFELSDDQISAHQGTVLAPQQSDGLPAFAVQSLELRDQKEHLRSISKPHPDQLDDLSHVSQEQLSSIAELLRKAVMDRRLALGEDSASVDQSLDSISWSVETTPRP